MATPYFLSMINPAIVVMGALFLIFLALLVYIFSKVFRDKYGNVSTVTVGIISFCISVLIVYFGKDTIYNIIDGLRLSNTILYVLSGIAVLVLLYLFRRRLKFCMILMLAGAGLILIGALTDWFYQKWFVILFGIILLLLGIWLCARGPRLPHYQKESSKDYPSYKKKSRELRAKQEYEYYKRLEEQRKVQKRDLTREQRRQIAKEEKLKERYARRFGNRAARKRFGK